MSDANPCYTNAMDSSTFCSDTLRLVGNIELSNSKQFLASLILGSTQSIG